MATGYMEAQSVPILPEHIWKNVSPNAAATSYGNKPPIIGSGPFETVAFNKGAYVKMVRNPYYYGKMPTVSTIYFEMYQNPDTMVADLQAGRIDGAWGIPAAEFKQLQSVSSIQTAAYPYYEWSYLEFNCYDKAELDGQSGAARPRVPSGDQLRPRQAASRAVAVRRARRLPPPPSCRRTRGRIPTTIGSLRRTRRTRSTSPRPANMLTAAGYPLKNGARLDKQGKPITLRLFAASSDNPGIAMAKLITGWLQQLGLNIKLSVIDDGTLTNDLYNYKGNTPAPNFDMVVWWWYGWFDPGQTLNALMTSQMGNLNEPWWSNAQYDKLGGEQVAATDPQKRQAIVWQMQQIMYQQSPWIPLTYPDTLEAWNTAKWTGWTRQFNNTGGAWELEGNIYSYLNLQPKAASASSTGGSGSKAALVGGIIVAVIIVGGVAWFLVRRRSRHVEDEV